MKAKALVALAVGSLFGSAAAFQPAELPFPSSAHEHTFSMSTLDSLDTRMGGFKGWGPIPNLETPWSPNESAPARYAEDMREAAQHERVVTQARREVWVANAPLRVDYELLGRRRPQGGSFFSRLFSGSR